MIPANELDLWSALALEYLDQGVTVFDQNLRLVAWNERVKNLLGFPDELIQFNTSIEEIFRFNAKRDEYGDGDIDELVTERITLAKTFKPHNFERARPDGTVIEVRGTPLPHNKGFVTTYTDITERKLTEQQLEKRVERRTHALQKESEAREKTAEALRRNDLWIRQITDTVPVLIAYVNADLQYQFANRKHLEWFNLNPDELLGTSIFDRVESHNRKQFRLDAKAVLTGKLVTNEYDITRHDGRSLDVSITFVPHKNEHQEVEGFFFLGQDLTEFNLTQHQLAESHKMQALGQMTGGIAHDFNNLLTIILGNLSMLNSGEADRNEIQEIGLACGRAARRGSELIQRLLSFSRHQSLNPNPTDINKLIDNIKQLLKRTLGENIDIITQLNPDLPPALVDATQLETSLLNLALNARDAMPSGGILTITTAHSDNPTEPIKLSVSDQGSGMGKKMVERVFEPFFTTKPKGSGTGLGLSMVYGFVKQSGGHIHIHSRLKHGTTVEITLPAARRPLQPTKTQDKIEPDAPATARILLVEDDTGVRDYVSKALHRLGYHIEIARNGDEALQRLQQAHQFDLVLTDIIMPGSTNGIALADHLSQNHPDTCVLCMTGYSDQLDASIEEEMLIRKPFSTADLAAKIKQGLNK